MGNVVWEDRKEVEGEIFEALGSQDQGSPLECSLQRVLRHSLLMVMGCHSIISFFVLNESKYVAYYSQPFNNIFSNI